MPTPYVDSALQVSNPNVSNVETIKNLQDCFEAAIGEYLEYRNPVSCCEKLEKLVTLVYNESEMKSLSCLLNHLFLDAYTALASAYKLRAYELPVLKEAFEMSKASAAYSLLLAVMVHHLFLYETSFTVSALNFWFSAGESLLSLAKNSFWEPGVSIFAPSSCYQTAQLNRLFLCPEEQILELEEINTQFMKCAADDITNSWRFLTCGRGFLDEIKGLEIKCSWTKESCIGFQSNGYFNTSSMRLNLYNLGIHCLIHAAFLSCICYGRDSEVACNVLSILVSEGVLATHPLLTC